jgi:hypothetical protein
VILHQLPAGDTRRLAAQDLGAAATLMKPVTPSTTVSVGPPPSAAITGRPAAIASRGTKPKCSRTGV